MRLSHLFVVFVCVIGIVAPASGQSTIEAWSFESQRSEIAPRHWVADSVLFDGIPTLALAGGGKAHADGRWVADVAVRPGTTFAFAGKFVTKRVEEHERSVFARLSWQDASGRLVDRPEYPETSRSHDTAGWHTLSAVYESPAGASHVIIELVYRWDADGEVYFSLPTLTEVAVSPPRPATLAAIKYRPKNDRTDDQDFDVFARLVGEAAQKGADIVTLPEGITVAGSGKTYVEASENIPGPTTDRLGDVARQNRVYIVAGLLERDGEVVYNTAVLIDRAGKLAGKYRKVSLPREEYEGGITAGDSFPVFETDFGRIGMMICWDVQFPEAARSLAMNGAEIIFMPIWDGDTILARARAIENQIFLVSSSYDMETGIFDRTGNLLSEATEEESIALTTVDLNERQWWPWLGDLKSRIRREIPPVRSAWR